MIKKKKENRANYEMSEIWCFSNPLISIISYCITPFKVVRISSKYERSVPGLVGRGKM